MGGLLLPQDTGEGPGVHREGPRVAAPAASLTTQTVANPPASISADPHLAPVLAAHAAAPEGSKLRDYLDAAIANASPAGHDASNPPKSLTPEQGRKLRKELASAHADAHTAGNLTPEDDAAFGRAMEGLGVKPLHEVGATVPFDPATMESASGISTGTPVTVSRRGWSGLYGDGDHDTTTNRNNVRRAVVEENSGNSTNIPSTTVDTTTGSGDTTPVPATPAGGNGGKPMDVTTSPAKAAHDRIMADLQQRWEAAKAKGHSSTQRTVVAAFRVDSKPTVAKFGPHEGKQVVKVTHVPVVTGSAHDGGVTLGAGNALSPSTDWVPVERVEEWKQNARDLFGVDNMPMYEGDRPEELQGHKIARRLREIQKGGAA